VIVQIGKFVWAVSSYGGRSSADVFARHYELHYQQKKIRLKGNENTLAAQFRCITFHPSHYEGRVKLTPAMKHKWSSGWVRNWFYCNVPSQKTNVREKGMYPLWSEMNALDYLTEAPHRCAADDANNLVAFEEAAAIIGGHNAVEEFLTCDIWPLSDGWEFVVERMDSPLSKVIVPMPKVTAIIRERETGVPFEARIASAANQLDGNYSLPKHRTCAT
jgi:hypothetical protein